MARFNSPTRGSTKTTNRAGGVAYKLDPKLELYSAVVTTSLVDNYYENGGERLERIVDLIKRTDPVFVGKLAVYAREQMYLRSIPLVLATTLSQVHSGDNLVSKVVSRIVNRVDEITELLSYYITANEREKKNPKKLGKLSKQIQKGLQSAFNKFNEFQFSKYNRDGAVKLRDALFLVHPKAKDDKQQKVFDAIAKDELKVAETWEVESTRVGQRKFESEAEKRNAQKEMWEKMIDSEKMGYMAVLRNLRNFLEYGVSTAHLKKVAARLGDREEVANSKQFPFRFLSAYREIESTPSFASTGLLDALESAMEASAVNIPWIDEKSNIAIFSDMSGSMDDKVSPKSTIARYEIGNVLAMLLRSKMENVITGIFGEDYKTVTLPKEKILANTSKVAKMRGEVGHSTNGHKAVRYLEKNNLKADKVMLFTDCQLWNDSASWGERDSLKSAWEDYKAQNPNAKLYIFDLAGYGDTPVSVMREDVVYVAGWSDRIFHILEALENGSSAVKEIEKVVL